jgi:hypothetical protein
MSAKLATYRQSLAMEGRLREEKGVDEGAVFKRDVEDRGLWEESQGS